MEDFFLSRSDLRRKDELRVVAWSALESHVDVFEGTGQVRTGLICANNPINNVDPSGKIGPLGWAAAVAVGVLIFAAVYSAQTYSKMEANKEYARTLPGTPITLHGSSYDDLTPAGRDAVDIHEAVHQGQPLFRGNETEAYQVEYGYEKEKLNDPNSNLTEAERAELKMLMDDSMDHLVKFKKDCP